MIVTLQVDGQSVNMVASHLKNADKAAEVFSKALGSSVFVGAEKIREWLASGVTGLTMRHQGSGLAASVSGWMLDATIPLAAVGVPSNSPAAQYAGILNYGGTIYPKNGKFLAIPISPEAKQYTSPRQMTGLVVVSRPGKPSMLVRTIGKTHMEVHWLLLASVYIFPRFWLSDGVETFRPQMVSEFEDCLNLYIQTWKSN